jgi:O-antigen ligase
MHLNSRVAYDFWRWEIISVTANGLYYQMAVGMAFGFLFSDFRKEAKLLAFLILGISGVNATLLGHRTALYIVVILLIYNMTVTLIKAEIPARRKRRVVFAGFAMSALAAILIATDFRGLRTWIVESHLFQRMTNADAVHSTDRALIWKSFFEKALYYPFGGSAYPLADMQRWVHNLWLDVYYKVGVIPCLALVLVTVAIFRQYRMVCRRYKRTGNNRAATVLTNIYLAFALNCMVEPVIDANPYVLISFFIIAGCVSGILRREQVAA